MGSLSINPAFSPVDSLCWTYPFMPMANTSTTPATSTTTAGDQVKNGAASTEEDEEENTTTIDGKESVVDCGQSKLYARGHWRPAEDSKLKQLVALHGPQNWNLIAQKLNGRSGILYYKVYILCVCFVLILYLGGWVGFSLYIN